MRRIGRVENRKTIAAALMVAISLFVAFASVASAAEIHVPDDHATIQQAVNAAGAGDTIVVRDGTYIENVDVGKRLTIRSVNGSAVTTVKAANPGDDIFDVTVDSVNITGFTVRGSSYAGICLGGVKYCNISGNRATENRHGFHLHSSCYNRLTDNTAEKNTDYGFSSSPTLTEMSSQTTLHRRTIAESPYPGLSITRS